jgi:hypothetical protein
MRRLGRLLLLALLVAAPRLARAVGEQNGRIGGTITEAQTGAPVPGATVTVSGSSLIGGPRSVTSGDDGRYELVELPPGRYDVQVSYEGVKPTRRRVVVRQGELVPLDIAWSPELAQEEVTVVVEERHLTKPDSTQSGTVLSADSESKVATGRSYQDIALQVAGVVDVNGGGNPQVKGGNYTMNHWMVDGLDITDPVTNTFSSNINFDSIASEEVLTGGMEAQYNSLGGVVNLITNAGSDEWHVDSSFYLNNARFSAAGQYGNQLYNGIKDFSQIVRAPTQSYNLNLNFGGPILKHRLWFNFSFEYGYRESSQPAGPPLNIQEPPLTSHRFLMRLKLTWAPNDKHRVTFSISADPAIFNFVDQDGRLPVAEDYQTQGGPFAILQWDYFKSQNLNTNIQLGFQYNGIIFGPQGQLTDIPSIHHMFSDANNHYDPNRPQHINLDDGSAWYNGGASGADRRYTVQFDPSVAFRGHLWGYHDAKIGIQSRLVYNTSHISLPGNRVFSDSGGGPGETGLCSLDAMNMVRNGGRGCDTYDEQAPFDNHRWGIGVGLYLQDRWKPFKRLTVLPGIRIDFGHTENTLGQTVSNLLGIGPRLGFALDITGDQKTIFTAFYGRANETLSLLPTVNADVTAVDRTFKYNTASQQFELDHQSGGATGYRLDPNHGPDTVPHTDEVLLGLRREIFHDSVAGIEYTYKRISNIWDAIEINQIWDPSGTRVVGYVNGTPQQVFRYTTPDNNYRIYQGIDFSVESRPTPNWDVYAAYTLSWLYGPGAEEFGQIGRTSAAGSNSQFYNPRQAVFYDGFLPEDTRHQLKIRGSYTWKGLILGATLQYYSGTPLTKRFYNKNDAGYTNKRSPQGTDPGVTDDGKPLNDATQVAELRTPDVLVIDAKVAYDFHALIKQHIVLLFDFFNLLNLNSGTGIVDINTPQYGQVSARQTPFRFQIGLRYTY